MTEIPPPYRQCYEAQTRIGWNHFIRGRITGEMKTLIKQETRIKKPTTHFTSDWWLRKTIEIMIDTHLVSWKSYNALKHKHLQNPFDFRATINRLTTMSKNYSFDNLTRQWFHITDDMLRYLNSQQIH